MSILSKIFDFFQPKLSEKERLEIQALRDERPVHMTKGGCFHVTPDVHEKPVVENGSFLDLFRPELSKEERADIRAVRNEYPVRMKDGGFDADPEAIQTALNAFHHKSENPHKNKM